MLSLGLVQEIEDIDRRERSTFFVAQGTGSGRRTGSSGRGVNKGDSASVGIGCILD